MIFGEPTDGAPEKLGTILGLILSVVVFVIFALTLSPVFGF